MPSLAGLWMTTDPSTLQWIALGISLLSLIVACGSMAVSWRVAARDKANFRLDCQYLPKSGIGVGFLVAVVNSGRRPVTVDSAFLVDRDGRKFSYHDISMQSAQFGTFLPTTLQESERVSLFFPIWHLRSASRDPRDYRLIQVHDTMGRRRSASLKRQLRGIPDDKMFKPKDQRGEE
jgi:hypothetical protein